MEPLSLRFTAIPGPLTAACIFAGVLIVHPTQPGAFHDIQSACNAAEERDTILVQSGTYPGFEVADQWLTIAADSTANVVVDGGVLVHDLQAGKRLTLIGMSLRGNHGGLTSSGIDAGTNDGAIRIFDCTISGADAGGPGLNGSDAVRAQACADVAISRSQINGGLGGIGYVGSTTSPGRGGTGLSASQSSVVVHDSTLGGGGGANSSSGTWLDGGNGGDGAVFVASTLFASRSTIAGGGGGNGCQCGPSLGSAGGNGLIFNGGPEVARLVSVTTFGGTGGHGRGLAPWSWSTNGYAIGGGPIIDLGPIGRSMNVLSDPIREGHDAIVQLTGQPGDRVRLFVTTFAGSVFNPGWNGQQLFASTPAPVMIDVGVVNQLGMLNYTLPFAELGPGVSARTFWIQPAFSSATHRMVLGTPIPMLVLDSSY